jgi:ATP-binding cassette, subfamily C (CFTR/MRP), member 1
MGAVQVPLGGSRPLTKLPSVFEVHAQSHPPLCGNSEGWGPISDIRYDFTPCFLDVWIVFAAAWGIVLGAGAVWYLLKKRIPQEVPKNWHFYAKLYV